MLGGIERSSLRPEPSCRTFNFLYCFPHDIAGAMQILSARANAQTRVRLFRAQLAGAV
ncbi:MAG: hypothetical protein ACHREM_18270 [Polyangiales bacterium]